MRKICWMRPLLVSVLMGNLFLLGCSISINTASTPVPSEPPTRAATATLPPTATNTARPTQTPRPTATPNVAATQAYQEIADKVQGFVTAGYVPSASGEYRELPDQTYSWAQINWFQAMGLAGWVLKDYYVQSDIAWESALTNPDTSGCGFIFRLSESYDGYYAIFLTTTGEVWVFSQAPGGYLNKIGTATFGQKQVNSSATFGMLVSGKTFQVFVNDKLIKTFYGFQDKLMQGDLAYTIWSGTNKDFGTRCTFTKTRVWVLAP